MYIFKISAENYVTAHVTRPIQIPAGERCFADPEELGRLVAKWPAARLVEIWNKLPSAKKVSRFTDRKAAIRRIRDSAQALQPSQPEKKPPAPRALPKPILSVHGMGRNQRASLCYSTCPQARPWRNSWCADRLDCRNRFGPGFSSYLQDRAADGSSEYVPVSEQASGTGCESAAFWPASPQEARWRKRASPWKAIPAGPAPEKQPSNGLSALFVRFAEPPNPAGAYCIGRLHQNHH